MSVPKGDPQQVSAARRKSEKGDRVEYVDWFGDRFVFENGRVVVYERGDR